MESQPQNPEFTNNPDNFHLQGIQRCSLITDEEKNY